MGTTTHTFTRLVGGRDVVRDLIAFFQRDPGVSSILIAFCAHGTVSSAIEVSGPAADRQVLDHHLRAWSGVRRRATVEVKYQDGNLECVYTTVGGWKSKFSITGRNERAVLGQKHVIVRHLGAKRRFWHTIQVSFGALVAVGSLMLVVFHL